MEKMTSKQRLALLATIIGSGVVFLDGSVVSLALVKMAASLHSNFASMQWVIDGYTLSLSALILLGGSLGDIFGRKRVYLIGLVGFGVVSILCGLSTSMPELIMFRIIQGIFGALLVPGALAIINTNFDSAKLRGAAIGAWTAWTAAFAIIGPVVGGYIVDKLNWNWVFFINVPLIALCFALAWSGVVESQDEVKHKVDVMGAALAALGLVGITYGLIEGPAQSWHALPITALILGVLISIAFVVYETRAEHPMLNLSLFKSANFTAANVSTFAMYGALSGFFFALVIHLEQTVGFTAFKSGISLLPATLLLIFLSSRVGRLSGKYGPRLFMTVGPILAALGMLLLLPLKQGSSFATGVLPGVLIFGLGLSLTVAPLTTTVMSAVKQSQSGIASAVNNAVSRVAGLFIVALLGILGASHAYIFATTLCVILAAGAGVLSYVLVKNPT